MREIVIKIFVFFLVLLLLVIELLKINVELWEIIIKLVILVLMIIIIFIEVKVVRKKKKLCHAFIYQHKENHTIQYCANDQGDDTRDFHKIGEGQVPCELVGQCYFK